MWTPIGLVALLVVCACPSDDTQTRPDDSELESQDRGSRPGDAGPSDLVDEHADDLGAIDASLEADHSETVDLTADNAPDTVEDSTGCAPNEHLCDEICQPDTPETGCLNSVNCEPCSAPENGYAVCVEGACSFQCNFGYVVDGDSCVEASGCELSSPAAPTSVGVVAPDQLCDDCGFLNWDPVDCATYYVVDFTCWLSTYSTDVGNITSAENCRDSHMDEGEGCGHPGVSAASVRACNASGCSSATEATGWELLWCMDNACLPCG